MSKSKIVALIILVAIIGGLVAYGFISSCTTLSDGDKGARIPIHLASFPESFDPAAQQYDDDTMQFFSLIYTGLTRVNSEGEVYGALAESWSGRYNERDEAYVITFKIKETYWDNGSRVRADDFVFAWKRILSPEFQSPHASTLYPIKNAAEVKAGTLTSDDLMLYATDTDTLEVYIDPRCYTESYEEADGKFDANLFARMVASPAFAPLSEDVVTRNAETWDTVATDMRTNGPFKVSTILEDVQIILERNQFYFRNPEKEDDIPLDKKVLPHKLICYYGENNIDEQGKNEVDPYTISELYTLFEENDLFYLSNFDKETYSAHKDSVKTEKVLSTYAFFFNTKSETLADKDVRKALSAAIDRNELVERIGTGQVAATGIVPHGVFDVKENSSYRNNAGDVITNGDASGLKGKRGTLTIRYLETDEAGLVVAEYAKEVWEANGFKVDIKKTNAKNYKKALSTNPEDAGVEYDVIAVNLAMHSVDPLSYLAQFSSICSGGYISIEEGSLEYAVHSTGLKDDEFDALVKEAIYCGNTSRRIELAKEIEKKLVDLCPATPLFFSTNSYKVNGKLGDVKKFYGGAMNFTRAELEGYEERNRSEDILSGVIDESK